MSELERAAMPVGAVLVAVSISGWGQRESDVDAVVCHYYCCYYYYYYYYYFSSFEQPYHSRVGTA